MRVEAIASNETVWVNSDEGCIGRFGKRGIDIHRLPSEQGQKGQCLSCTYGPTTVEDWHRFVEEMKELHGVEIKESLMPRRFRSVR